MADRGNWKSRIGFILAASGSAVGLGNIWRFPYLTGEDGGALFVLIYIVAILGISLPVLLAELSLGRFTGKNPVGAFNAIRPKSGWKMVGYLGVTTGVMILSFYSVVAGWTLGYFWKTASGGLGGVTAKKSGEIFATFTADPASQIGFLFLFILLTAYIVQKGVVAGIEWFSKVLMPLLVLIMLILLVRSLTLPGAGKGIAFYLKPRFSAFKPRVILDAMGQSFFSLSLGMGTMITYGSYLNKRENLASSAAWIAFFDTMIAILAGFIIFPAVFSQNMDPAQGPGLVFNILPVIFANMPGGSIFGVLFFVLLAIAALTSTISMLEVPVAYLVDEKKWSRKKAVLLFSGLSFLVGIPSALAGGGVRFFSRLPVLHISFLDLWNKVWGNVSLSIGALFIALFVAYIWKAGNACQEIFGGKSALARWWIPAIKYLAPLAIIFILIYSLVS